MKYLEVNFWQCTYSECLTSRIASNIYIYIYLWPCLFGYAEEANNNNNIKQYVSIKVYKPDLLSNDINVVCSSIIGSLFRPQHLDVVFFGKDSSTKVPK